MYSFDFEGNFLADLSNDPLIPPFMNQRPYVAQDGIIYALDYNSTGEYSHVKAFNGIS